MYNQIAYTVLRYQLKTVFKNTTNTTHDKLNALLNAGHPTESGVYVMFNEYIYDGIHCSKISENKISSIYTNMFVSSVTRTCATTPRIIKDKRIYAIHQHGSELETKAATNIRKYNKYW